MFHPWTFASRFADLAGTKAVAETEQIFDELGRVTDIVHERAATEFADYDLTWDAAGRISDFDFDSLVGDDGDAAYTYDDTNQLTGSDYASDWQTDESYVYDDNGNRELVDGSTTYTTGDHNRLTSDGTYSYTYDNEGNVLTKTNISTSEFVEYTWDHRNRLTKVTFKNSGGTATKIVEYAYDSGQRWVRKTLDTDADGTIEESRMFVHDNGQIVLDFEKTGTAAAGNSDLAHRYLWGNSVDQLLADETVDDGSEDDVACVLTDHLNSVRDLAVYNPITQSVSIVKHVTYDAFGNVTSDNATGVKSLFLYTARPFDPDTDLQNNLNRWYDLSTGRWMSVDPIGFVAGDVNLHRYVGNSPTLATDSNGLLEHIEFEAPRIDGTAGMHAEWEDGECCLTFYVDSVFRKHFYRGPNRRFVMPFYYNWLKRGDVNGTITITTNTQDHNLAYTGTVVEWNANATKAHWQPVENLGLSFSMGHAEGHYTRYGGNVHNKAAVWDTEIELSAQWVYNREGGDANIMLYSPRSIFGTDGTGGSRATGTVSSIGADNSPPGKPYYTDSVVRHVAPFDKWFIAGASWAKAYVEVDLYRGITSGAGTFHAKNALKYELPGVPRPN